MNKDNNIFLIGFMGSGKSTVGKILAQKMNRQFLDSDREIERKTGQSISELFSEKGEMFFRELEQTFVSELKQDNNLVVACGGGLPCFNGLMNELKSKGTVIFLNASVETLSKRLFHQKKKRPLLSDLKEDEFVASIQKRLAERMELYLLADEIVEVDDSTIDSLVEEIISRMKH